MVDGVNYLNNNSGAWSKASGTILRGISRIVRIKMPDAPVPDKAHRFLSVHNCLMHKKNNYATTFYALRFLSSHSVNFLFFRV